MSSPAPSPYTPKDLIDTLLLDIAVKAKHLQLSSEEAAEFAFEKDWNALKPVLLEWERSTHLKYVRQTLEKRVLERVISDWVEKNVSGSTLEKRSLKAEIESCIKEDREEELREYLPTVLELGATKAIKTIKHKKKWGEGGYGGYFWEAIVGIVRLVIVISIFTVAQSKFQTVVFALLVLTYYAVYSNSLAHFQSRTRMAFGIDGQFKLIRRLQKEEISKDDRELNHENEQELANTFTLQNIRYWIQMGFFSLIWLVAMWKLLSAVFL